MAGFSWPRPGSAACLRSTLAKAIPTCDARSATRRSRLRQGEDGAGRGNAAQEMFAERNQCRCRLSGNCAGDQHTAAERAAQTFESADQIDCRADRGEVQPAGSADIAPQHFAEMQELNLQIKQRFDAEKIEFAFPTQTVYVKAEAGGNDTRK